MLRVRLAGYVGSRDDSKMLKFVCRRKLTVLAGGCLDGLGEFLVKKTWFPR